MSDVFWCEVTRQSLPLKPHFHDTYALGLISHGVSRYDCGAHHFLTDAATAHLINPSEVHAALASAQTPISYTTFHVSVDYVRGWLSGGCAEPVFGRYVEVRPAVLAALREASRGPADASTRQLAVESMLALVLPLLMDRGDLLRPVGLHETGLRRAHDFMCAHPAQAISLAELAGIANLERSHFVRQFKRLFGLPPHQWLLQLRVIEARKQLFGGTHPAQAAVAAGFCDQSHLIRQWRSVYAVPPSRLHKVNFVQ